MTRTPALTIWSCFRGKQSLEAMREETLSLERQKDGELAYVPDDVPEAPPSGGRSTFFDIAGEPVGSCPMPAPGVDAVLVGERVFVRRSFNFHEVFAVQAEMP